MFRMILADDEPVITKGIRMLVDWEELGIQIEACCDNGLDALHEILSRKPDLALLDISMPGRTGIEILKELHAAGADTKVIFISGFQEFSYARDALTYGAVDYLLKPIKREALLEAVGKCLPGTRDAQQRIARAGRSVLNAGDEAYRAAMRADAGSCAVAALTVLGLAEKEPMERQLIAFSVLGRLERITREKGRGVAFQKKNELYLILEAAPGTGAEDSETYLRTLLGQVQTETGWTVGAVYSPDTGETTQLPPLAMECRQKCQYFYFGQYLPDTVLALSDAVFPERDLAGLHALQARIAGQFVGQDQAVMWDTLREYEAACAAVADGNQDAAVFYLLSCLRAVTERMAELGIQTDSARMVDGMLEAARDTKSYAGLLALFENTCRSLYAEVAEALRKNDKKDIVKATDYIKAHYKENLTLEVMAKQIHMNPFYFSSYFKKQTGRNFKDFLNAVRLNHALELLVGTDLRSYEIAEEVGFKDYRYFTELFSRAYGRTPTAYRKAMSAAPAPEE